MTRVKVAERYFNLLCGVWVGTAGIAAACQAPLSVRNLFAWLAWASSQHGGIQDSQIAYTLPGLFQSEHSKRPKKKLQRFWLRHHIETLLLYDISQSTHRFTWIQEMKEYTLPFNRRRLTCFQDLSYSNLHSTLFSRQSYSKQDSLVLVLEYTKKSAEQNTESRASLVAQWLRICLLMQGTRVRALVWEDPTCRGATRPVSHNYWACASGACAPQQERPR